MAQNIFDTIKKTLMKQQEEVEENLRSVQGEDAATEPALAETSEPGMDSWIAESHTRTVALVNQLKKMGSNIKAALYRMKDGSYGKCTKCGNSIETNRLLVVPTATLCLSCSKKQAKS